MKNLLRLFSFLLVLFSTMFLNSCIPEEDEDEEVSISIVGTWEELNATNPEIAVFTGNGTGYLQEDNNVQEFTYVLQQSTLNLFFLGSNTNSTATIDVVGENMTVVPNDGGDIITFRRISTVPRPVPEVPANQAAELVGTWESEEFNSETGQTDNERIAFDGLASEGGEGYIQFNSTNPLSFSYTVADDEILINFTEFGVRDTVRYSVDADILTIVSEAGSFTYSRISNSVLDPREVTTTSTNFVGTWEFNDVSYAEKWIFNSDNIGFINNEGSVVDFTYAVSGNNLTLNLDFGGGTVQTYDWTYEITSDILTLFEEGVTIGSLTKISDTPEEKPEEGSACPANDLQITQGTDVGYATAPASIASVDPSSGDCFTLEIVGGAASINGGTEASFTITVIPNSDDPTIGAIEEAFGVIITIGGEGSNATLDIVPDGSAYSGEVGYYDLNSNTMGFDYILYIDGVSQYSGRFEYE